MDLEKSVICIILMFSNQFLLVYKAPNLRKILQTHNHPLDESFLSQSMEMMEILVLEAKILSLDYKERMIRI